MDRLSPEAEARFWAGVEATSRFHMGTGPVHEALYKISAILDAEGIPYAIVDGMALNLYGYERATTDVDVLMTRASLEQFKRAHLGLGYVEKFAGSKSVRDTENNVGIDILIAGDYPGDGKPKPVSFPDPATAAIRGDRVALLPIEKIVELKLASGMTTIHRAKDLADVVELIKHAHLSRELGEAIDPSVRARYFEIWDALQTPDPTEAG
jgi:hypothetical protein